MENQYDPTKDPNYKTKVGQLKGLLGRNHQECAKAIEFFYGDVDRAFNMIVDGEYDPVLGDLVTDRPQGSAPKQEEIKSNGKNPQKEI